MQFENKKLPFYLVLFSLLFQFILFKRYLNTDIISALHPFFGDSKEYIKTNEYWVKSGNFTSTFQSGWRLPGYALFILIIYKLGFLINCNYILLLRIFQLLLTSFIPFFAYKSLLNFTKSEKVSLFGAFIVAIYYPFYFFTPEIGAEAISLFFISILLFQVSLIVKQKVSINRIFLIAINIVILTYFKPNHLLFSVPLGIILINKQQLLSGKIFSAIKDSVLLAFIMILFLLPWIIFVSLQNKIIIPLATTSGIDMVIGTGLPINADNRDSTSLTYKYEVKYNLAADTIFLSNKTGLSRAKQNKVLQAEAISIWKHRPWVTFKYGFVKIAHSLGLGFRGMKDYFSLIVLFTAILILIFSSAFRRKYKILTMLTFICFILFFIQSFIYFGDMRLRILMLDMPIVLTICLFFYDNFEKRFRNSIF